MEVGTSLRSWQQAFEDYPIATTKAIEKQLRASVTHDKDKLRGLVGGNYRELLATAEEIVSLSLRTKNVESQISEIGQQCKPPPSRVQPTSNNRQSIVGQLRVLHRSCSIAATALGKTDLVLSAQLVVISRLLVKSLSDHETHLRSLGSMRNKVASLQVQLLRHVDLQLSDPRSTPTAIIEAICAYCLVKGASSSDALDHVQYLRLEKLRVTLSQERSSDERITECLRYQLLTLRVLKGLTGRALGDALGALQKRPILEERSLQQLEPLDSAGTRKLIPPEILSFIPYFRRNQLSQVEIQSMLRDWSHKASQVLLQSLDLHLANQTRVADVLGLRKELYATLLPGFFATAGQHAVHDTLRQALRTHIERICSQQVGKLRELALHLTDTSTNPVPTQSLWQEDVVKMGLSRGAPKFIQQMQNRRSGISGQVAATSKSLVVWIASVQNIVAQFEALGSVRWRDLMEEPDDEQEEEVVEVVKSLTQEDPSIYSSRMRTSLKSVLADVEATFHSAALECLHEKRGVHVAIGLLRSIRQSAAPIRQAFPAEAHFGKLDEVIPQLYAMVADEVLERLSAADSISGMPYQNAESSPENLPSPKAFSTLRQLSNIMIEVGGVDLWSRVAVTKVKTLVGRHIFEKQEKGESKWNLFDETYLCAALDRSPTREPGENSEGDVKAAQEYWARTKLLFGVLA